MTLLGRQGGIFAALRRPTAAEEGLGIIDWPDPKGSEWATCRLRPPDSARLPGARSSPMDDRLPDGAGRGQAILDRLVETYPEIAGSRVLRVLARTTVNPTDPEAVGRRQVQRQWSSPPNRKLSELSPLRCRGPEVSPESDPGPNSARGSPDFCAGFILVGDPL